MIFYRNNAYKNSGLFQIWVISHVHVEPISVSLMNTIDVLWQDNEDLEYRVKDQRNIMEQMSSHLQEMGVSILDKVEIKLVPEE